MPPAKKGKGTVADRLAAYRRNCPEQDAAAALLAEAEAAAAQAAKAKAAEPEPEPVAVAEPAGPGVVARALGGVGALFGYVSVPFNVQAGLWVVAIVAAFLTGWMLVCSIVFGFWGMYHSMEDRERQPGERSAYSVFNPNCEAITGTFKAEDYDRALRSARAPFALLCWPRPGGGGPARRRCQAFAVHTANLRSPEALALTIGAVADPAHPPAAPCAPSPLPPSLLANHPEQCPA